MAEGRSDRFGVPDLSSESESDDNFAYRLPRYAAQNHAGKQRRRPAGTPERPIKIPDMDVVGTANQPIWISDAEASGTETETDTSQVAVKGVRISKSTGSQRKPPPVANLLTGPTVPRPPRTKPNPVPDETESTTPSTPTSAAFVESKVITPPRTIQTKKSSPVKKPSSKSSPKHSTESPSTPNTEVTPRTPEAKKTPPSRKKTSKRSTDSPEAAGTPPKASSPKSPSESSNKVKAKKTLEDTPKSSNITQAKVASKSAKLEKRKEEGREIKTERNTTTAEKSPKKTVIKESPTQQQHPSSPVRSAKDTRQPTPTKRYHVVDMTTLSQEDDPALEKELEDIILNGRSGMISGTPGAHDIEKGRNIARRPAPPIEEDDADKSWHTPIVTNKPNNKRRQRFYLILAVLGLLSVTGCLIQVLLSKKKVDGSNLDDTEPPLNDLQQAMHDIVTRITDSTILSSSTTPQYQARKWLLFQDTELTDANEDRVTQRYALACFYYATNGANSWIPTNWLIGNECDEPWYGLNCNTAGSVRAVVLGT